MKTLYAAQYAISKVAALDKLGYKKNDYQEAWLEFYVSTIKLFQQAEPKIVKLHDIRTNWN